MTLRRRRDGVPTRRLPIHRAPTRARALLEAGMLLEISLLALVGTWCLALGRLARTWRDAQPVALTEGAEIRLFAARDIAA